MIGNSRKNLNGPNDVIRNDVNMNFNRNIISTTTPSNTQQINEQPITTNILDKAKSVGRRSLISINRYSRNFLFSSNTERRSSLYSRLFPNPDTINDNDDLTTQPQLSPTPNVVETIMANNDKGTTQRRDLERTNTQNRSSFPHTSPARAVADITTTINAKPHICQSWDD